MHKATIVAPLNIIRVPVRRIEAPAMEVDNHINNNSTATKRTNCFRTFSSFDVSSIVNQNPWRKQKPEMTTSVKKTYQGRDPREEPRCLHPGAPRVDVIALLG